MHCPENPQTVLTLRNTIHICAGHKEVCLCGVILEVLTLTCALATGEDDARHAGSDDARAGLGGTRGGPREDCGGEDAGAQSGAGEA
jgi:hypothetical protein